MNNNNGNNQNSNLNGTELPLALTLVGGGLCYTYGNDIKLWFHENVVYVALGVMGILAICGYLIVRRIQKKNEQEIARMRRLQDVKAPSRPMHQYYRRKNEQEGSRFE